MLRAVLAVQLEVASRLVRLRAALTLHAILVAALSRHWYCAFVLWARSFLAPSKSELGDENGRVGQRAGGGVQSEVVGTGHGSGHATKSNLAKVELIDSLMPRVLYTVVKSSHTRDTEPRATVPCPGSLVAPSP